MDNTTAPGVARIAAFEHRCEVCGKTETLTDTEAFNAGWDYPPQMGAWQMVSPRTCSACVMVETLWWDLQPGGDLDPSDPMSWPENRRAALAQILAEPPAEAIRVLDRGKVWAIETEDGSRIVVALRSDAWSWMRIPTEHEDAGFNESPADRTWAGLSDIVPLLGGAGLQPAPPADGNPVIRVVIGSPLRVHIDADQWWDTPSAVAVCELVEGGRTSYFR